MDTGTALKPWRGVSGDIGLNVKTGGVRRDEMWI